MTGPVDLIGFGLNRAALAEGLAFARTLGLDPGQTLGMLRASMACSRIMDTKGKKMIHGDFAAQAKLSQHLKDIRLMLDDAAKAGAKLPLSETHRDLLQLAESLGFGQLDNSVILRAIEHCAENKNLPSANATRAEGPNSTCQESS